MPSVESAVRQLDAQGRLTRVRDRSGGAAGMIDYVREALDQALPAELEDFYRAGVARIGDFNAVLPIGNDRFGWRSGSTRIDALRHAGAAPVFSDGCGSLFGLDLTACGATPAVYFFDHEDGFAAPRWAAGSSLGAFLLILADSDRALDERWPPRWELTLDPDLERCPRAPAIWNAG